MMTDVSQCFCIYRIDVSVILIGDVIQANQCLILAEIKGCQVREIYCIVEK